MRFVAFLFGILSLALGWCAIPETWLHDKAILLTEEAPLPTREELFTRYPRTHIAVATLPERYRDAFALPPEDTTIYVGEAYFIDHCVHHHPDVGDDIYRQVQDILDAPDEVIIDRRQNGDGLVFSKKLGAKHYALVIRHYPDGGLVYKTLFPVGKKLYPKLPRYEATSPAQPSKSQVER